MNHLPTANHSQTSWWIIYLQPITGKLAGESFTYTQSQPNLLANHTPTGNHSQPSWAIIHQQPIPDQLAGQPFPWSNKRTHSIVFSFFLFAGFCLLHCLSTLLTVWMWWKRKKEEMTRCKLRHRLGSNLGQLQRSHRAGLMVHAPKSLRHPGS